MRRRSRDPSRSWRQIPLRGWIFIAGLAASLALYTVNAALFEVEPGSRFGLAYGVAATALLLTAALYGARRRFMRLASKLRLGSASAWLAFHLYGSLLFLLLVLMHSAFRLPTGTVTWWLWLLSLWTVGSGVAGRALQLWIPRALGSGLPMEVIYERIPELVDTIRKQAESLVAQSDESIQTMYTESVAPLLEAPRRRPVYFLDLTGGMQAELKDFDYLRTLLPAAEQEKLDQLARYFKTKLQLDAHYTLQYALRIWLWAHVPSSLALVAFVAVHLFSVLYY